MTDDVRAELQGKNHDDVFLGSGKSEYNRRKKKEMGKIAQEGKEKRRQHCGGGGALA